MADGCYGIQTPKREKSIFKRILDLHDKSIAAYALGHSNNNQLVFDSFDAAVKPTLAPIPCITVAGAIDTPAGSLKRRWMESMQRRACPVQAAALTTAPWRASGAFSNPRCTISNNFIPLRNWKKPSTNISFFFNSRRLQAKLKGLAPLAFRNQALVA